MMNEWCDEVIKNLRTEMVTLEALLDDALLDSGTPQKIVRHVKTLELMFMMTEGRFLSAPCEELCVRALREKLLTEVITTEEAVARRVARFIVQRRTA